MMVSGWRTGAVVVVVVLLSFADKGSGRTAKGPIILPVSTGECAAGLEKLHDIPYPRNCTDTCIASGDPHFNTFDCVKFEYHGKCSYTLVKNCGDGLENFEIIGEFHRLRYHKKLSVIKRLFITCEGTDILLDGSFGVTINGVLMTAATQMVSCGTISRYCNAVVISMNNGITIYWSSPYRALIQIDADADAMLTGNVCGLCGNNNDIKYDDFTTPDDTLVSDAVAFGDSWRTDLDCNECHDCDPTICQNNPQYYQQAQDLCSIFKDGTMPICGDINGQVLYMQCVNILCASLPETLRFCQLVNIYIEECVANGVEIRLHLKNGACVNGCHKNQIFIPYGDTWTDTGCSETCTCDRESGITCTNIQCDEHATCIVDPDGSSSCVCNEPEYTGDGLMCTEVNPCEPNPCLNGGICTAFQDLLSYECTCVHGYCGLRCQNPPPCSSNPCQNGGTCVNEGCNYRCVCPFAVWGGPTCAIRCYVCWACGDPHYNTFDNLRYDFQGKCMYTLAKSTEDFPNQFEVVANNIAGYWNTRVTITREVYVFLDFGADGWWSFCFRYGYGGILVNEASISLPYTNTDTEGRDRVAIRQAGSYTILSTNFGLYVVWNGVHCVFIVVPEFFKDQVQGLCGLFNLDNADDWTKPDGQLATSPNEFGNSWVYEEIEVCDQECTPATCEENPCENNPERSQMASVLCMFLDGTDSEGPFAVCYDVIDPTPYFENCKYDICAGQEMESICDDMANYAFDCRAEGVPVPGDWRDMVPACVIECDDGMEYNECDSACPATCSDTEAPSRCSEECLEGCHCKDGLLWTPDGCVSAEQCGCTQNGVYYAPNTEFVTEDCSQKCTCQMGGNIVCNEYGPCGSNALCTTRYGRRDCFCQNGFNGNGFDCIAWYTCRACGDPHYVTLDGKRYDFQGKCRYTLVKTISGDISFEIIANNSPWEYNLQTSLTRHLFISVYGLDIQIGFGEPVRVNGEIVNLPYYFDGKVSIYRACIYTFLVTDFGLLIKWDGNTCVTIRLPSTFMKQVAGLCGFFNGDLADDFKDPQLKLISNVIEFGNSWKYGADEDCDCTPASCPEKDPCDANPGVSGVCLPLTDVNGPFARCHDAVKPQPYLKDCSYDACSAENASAIICEHFERYVDVCRVAGVALNGWRNIFTQCAIDCGNRMRYTDCGNPCQPTCSNPNTENTKCGQRACVQGCECLPGLVLSGDECVEPTKCGCQYNGRYYMPMEKFVTNDCALRCLCVGNDQVECEPFVCGKHAACDVRDGVRGCYCEEGFKLLSDGKTCEATSPCTPNPCLNGGQCTETADMTSYICSCPYGQWTGPTCNIRCYQCYACGDPHYRTFDGKYYDFQGRCSYTLTKSLTGARHDFEVVGKNVGLWYWPVTLTREVYVYITHQNKNYEFTFKSGSTSVLVDDVAVNLPYYLYNDDETVFTAVQKMGYRTVLKTAFGLIVDWDGGSCVRLYLPESYRTFVNGLCGLFNLDRNDDFTDPESNLLSNANDFGNSWVYGECTTPCTSTTCPGDPCKGNAEATMTAQMLCQPLDADTGFSVFEECFDVVSPTEMFNNCEFDMCIDPNNEDILCEHFNLYATECRNAKVDIGNWRAVIQTCAIACGENMEYQYCGTACPATCADLIPEICATVCVEGCQCVQGYVLDNDKCIPQDQCGCTENGRYYQVGETVISDDCTTECTCQPGGALNCTQLQGCSENEVCQIKNGKRDCYCPVGFFNGDGVCQPIHTCSACGDPHYTTFDGRRYDYQGKCTYILAQAGPNAPNQFLVVGDNIPWARYPRATVTRFVYIYAYGSTVQFSWDTSNVLVNDEVVTLPYYFDNNKLIVYSVGRYKILSTDFGLRVIWDGYWCLSIQVPANFVNHVDGLCGHFSHDWTDDFTNQEGNIETSINSFGDSWAYGAECQPCTPETCPVEHPCDLDLIAAAVADDVCSPLTDNPGPFAACLDVVDPADYLFECRFDICADPSEEEAACSYLQRYASACQEAGVNVNGWRNAVPHCAIACDEFMTYSDCGPACPATCANPSAEEECTLACVQGCQCQQGFLSSGNTCVVQEECGCTYNGRYLMNEEMFVDETCDNECTCLGGNLECNAIACDDNAICEIQNGVRGCYCSEPYTGDGYTCITPCEQEPSPCQHEAQCVKANNANGYICRCLEGFSGPKCEQDLLLCSASGDPHYRDYYGKRFDFQGDCEYIFTQNCSSDIPEFKVIVANQKSSPGSRVSRTRTVTVMVYGQTIFLGQGRVVQVNNNGVATLPFYDTNYSIYRSGYWVTLKTDFNLVVEWSGSSTIKVKVPSSFQGNLCGLCGNGNEDRNGRRTPDGELEPNINVWGHSWATNQSECEMCTDCPTDEDVCDTVASSIKEDAEERCAIITATTGVFYPSNTGTREEPVDETSEETAERDNPPAVRAKRKRSITVKRYVGDTVLSERSHISTVLGDATGSSTTRDNTKPLQVRSKRQTMGVHAQAFNVRWSASGIKEGVPDPFTVNATVGFSDTTPQVEGTDLWKLSMYGSSNSDGSGNQFQRNEQILSQSQQGQSYLGGTNLTFVNAEGELDVTALGCDKEFRYLCFDFTKGIRPSIDFTFTSFQQASPTKITVCTDRCTEQGAPPVLVSGMEVHIVTAPLQAGIKDSFVANTTVDFASNSPDVSGVGLWKLSIYGSKTTDGSGEPFQRIEQVLTETQQAQSLEGANSIFFLESPGELDIHFIGCGEYQYICIDFTKGDSPTPDFEFESRQPVSNKYTLCIARVCEEDMDIDLTNGFVLVADLAGAIRIAALDTLEFQPIPLENLGAPVAIDFDPVDQMLYWTDVLKKTISRCYLDGSDQAVVLDLGNTSVADGLAIDVIHRHIYWTDTGYDTIERANLDGSARHSILDMDSQEPRAIVVDATNGRLFWTDWGDAPRVERSNLDGTDRLTLIDTDLQWPNGLAIDFTAGRMYWCDAGLNKIESSDLDGGERTLLINTGDATDIHPFDIGIYRDTILWSDWLFQQLVTMNISIVNTAQLVGSNTFARGGGLHIQYGGCTKEDDFFVPEGHRAVDPKDPCLECTCFNKELACVAMACQEPVRLPGQECTAYHVPGECCPLYMCDEKDCLDGGGNLVQNGETIGDPCSPCTCNEGQLTCLAYRCAIVQQPLGANCTLITRPGECCPIWDCQPGQGPFVNCHGVIDPAEYLHDCTYDWCATQDNAQLCDDIASYAAVCQMHDIKIGHWRDGVGCTLECSSNSHYELCPSACQATCANINDDDDEPCKDLCREGCVCDDGYIWRVKTASQLQIVDVLTRMESPICKVHR
ncbi:IgGFc-binding protein-like [Amphiura filiformis]|uniref:IgGFc-binding protein-like n=1 Tax=Amphiura filiformis TaxID=82378 RepID=UPI003B2256D5